MSTPIPPVSNNEISTATFIDLQLGATTYYISDAYKPITLNSNSYTQLGILMDVSQITYDYKTTAGTMTIVISGVPNTPDFLQLLEQTEIKGGDVEIRRAFFTPATSVIIPNEDYLRFKGIISNYGIEEETNFIDGRSTNTIIFECASTFAILEKKVAGQRTNGSDRRRFYPGSIDFDRVKFIQDENLPEFDR
tara:strand:+ start:1120 stop:1698 length:579 start_codon:yes stop_codon:yes gene_type:complete